MIRPGLFVAAGLLASTPAAAAEKRCGWLHNPTPGNWWLDDRHGQWVLSSQGGRRVRGMDLMPDMTTAGWEQTNGYYGYGCACLTVDTDMRTKTLKRLYAARPLPLRSCRMDKTLPKP